MAEQDEQGLVIVGSDGTEHEFPLGMDPQKAAGIVREQEAFAKSGPMLRSRTGQMYRPPAEGGGKEFVQGATDALNPMNIARGAKALWEHPVDTTIGAAAGLLKSPYRIAGGLITDPARTLGALAGGTAAGDLIPIGPKPLARGLGKGLERIGTKAEWPMQVAASHQVLSGNPMGLAVMAVPPVLRKVGRGLQDFGTSAEQLKSEADTLLQRGAPASTPPSIRITPPAKDYYKVAQENAAETAAPKAAAQVGNTSAEEIARLKAQGMSDETIAKIVAADTGTRNVAPVLNGGPARPSIRVTGKAATDLADGNVPTASKAPAPSDTRMTELAGKLGGREGVTPPRIPTQEGIPASKSKGAMSATPGLTRADLAEAGLNPDLNYKDLTPDMIDKIKSGRASRHMTNYSNAVTDKRLRSILEESLLMRNMERLR